MKRALLVVCGFLFITGVLTYLITTPENIHLVCKGEYTKTGETSAGKLYIKHIKHHIIMRLRLGSLGSEGVIQIKTENGNYEHFSHLNGGNYMVIFKKSPDEIPNETSKRVDNMKGTYIRLRRKLSLATQFDGYFTGKCSPRK